MKVSRLAMGYRSDGTRAEGGQYGTLSPTGAGVAGIPTDFGRYMLAQLKPGNPVLERRFGHDPRLPGMAMLFEEHPRNGQRVLSKNGDVPGYHDNLALLPDKGFGVYVVYNGDGVNGEATFAGQDLVNRVIDALYPGWRPDNYRSGRGSKHQEPVVGTGWEWPFR